MVGNSPHHLNGELVMVAPKEFISILKTAVDMVKEFYPGGNFTSAQLRSVADDVKGSWQLDDKSLLTIGFKLDIPEIVGDCPSFIFASSSTQPATPGQIVIGMIWLEQCGLHRDNQRPAVVVQWPNGTYRLLVTAVNNAIYRWEEYDQEGNVMIDEVYMPINELDQE